MNSSLISIFKPRAIFTSVISFGIAPLQMSLIVELGTPDKICNCRDVRFFSCITCSNIILTFIPTFYDIIRQMYLVIYGIFREYLPL